MQQLRRAHDPPDASLQHLLYKVVSYDWRTGSCDAKFKKIVNFPAQDQAPSFQVSHSSDLNLSTTVFQLIEISVFSSERRIKYFSFPFPEESSFQLVLEGQLSLPPVGIINKLLK